MNDDRNPTNGGAKTAERQQLDPKDFELAKAIRSEVFGYVKRGALLAVTPSSVSSALYCGATSSGVSHKLQEACRKTRSWLSRREVVQKDGHISCGQDRT